MPKGWTHFACSAFFADVLLRRSTLRFYNVASNGTSWYNYHCLNKVLQNASVSASEASNLTKNAPFS